MSTPAIAADGSSAELRPVIERSWMRSNACRVDQAMRLPFDDDIDNDCRLIRAAHPVIERLAETMSDTRHSLILADTSARLIHRWVGITSLNGKLDNASIAPGFGFAEEFAGTNGVGTALEEGNVVTVKGTEHFAAPLKDFACVGVPIHNPIRGNVEGIIDFSCLASDFVPLMTSLLVEVAKHIETRFAQQGSVAEQALLECFMRTSRGHRGPVIAMRPNLLLTNPTAVEHTDTTDQVLLWEIANAYAKSGRSWGVVDLSTGRYTFELTVLQYRPDSVGGVVLRLERQNANTVASTLRPPDALQAAPSAARGIKSRSRSGRSPQWKKLSESMEEVAALAEPVAFTGDDGAGKFWAAKRLAELRCRGGQVIDANELPKTQGALSERCHEVFSTGAAAIIRRIDRMAVPQRMELSDMRRQVDGPMPLIVTCTDDPRDTVVRALAGFTHQLWVPPLAQRLDDIVDLVPEIIADLEPDRVVVCSLPAQQLLMRYSWPGNVTELRSVLAVALNAAKGGTIDVAHLPAWLMKRTGRRQLSPLEQSQRDLIIDALTSVGNNRAEAARVLGIGRATLYRKLRALGIATSNELSG